MNAENEPIVLDIVFKAPLKNIWRAWTNPLAISKWFGSDPNGTVLNAQLDVHTGGHFEITFKDSNQTEHTCFGVYSEVVEFRRLSFSWTWKSEPGVESFVSINLNSEDNFTRMIFKHAGVGTASQHNYIKGWRDTFSKLERVLSQY